MKVFIFESDPTEAQYLQKMIADILDNKADVVLNPAPGAFVPTGKDMENALVLLDTRYKIPGGSFLTLARKIRETNEFCHICFMAPSPGDVGFCYKKLVRPSGFLLKPVEKQELRELISEIKRYEALRRTASGNPQLFLKTRGRSLVLRVSNVLYFTSLGKKILCYTVKEGELSFYGSLKNLESQYCRYFIRCHSGFLVNRQYIVSFSKKTLSLKLLGCEQEIPVSKSHCRDIEEFIRQGIDDPVLR